MGRDGARRGFNSLTLHIIPNSILDGRKDRKLTSPESWLKFSFARDIYFIERDHFITSQIEDRHLYLRNHDIDAYIKSRYTALERGPISLWAWKCKVARMSGPERAEQIRRLEGEIKVLEEVKRWRLDWCPRIRE